MPVAETVFIPLTVGGGIREVADIRHVMLNAGADDARRVGADGEPLRWEILLTSMDNLNPSLSFADNNAR